MFVRAAEEGNSLAARASARYTNPLGRRARFVRITEEQRREVDAVRAERAETRRVVVPALEDILYEPLPVLDHGFVRVVDYMGDDAAIVQAARVSYGRGTKKSRDDAGLVNYLLRNWHTSPFEMANDSSTRDAEREKPSSLSLTI